MPTTSTPSCSCPNGGNFSSGGDVHDIIGPLVAMDMKEPARLHPHDRRSRQGDAPLRQADHRGGRRRVRRRRRDHRHGRRHPLRHAGGEDRVPLHPRRARRLRHGRLRDPAAHHRAGPRRRASLHRPHHDARRRASAGASSTAWSPPRASKPRRSPSRSTLATGPTFAHGMTKTQLNAGMVDGPRPGDRGGSAGAGDLHEDAAISSAPTAPSSPRKSRSSRATDGRPELSRLAVLRGSPPRLSRRALEAWCAAESAGRSRRCRRRLPRARRAARPRRLAEAHRARSGRSAARSTCARSASRARRWPATTASPISPSPCRASAPARSRCSARRSSKQWLAKTRAGDAIAAFALSEPKSGSDVANIDMTAARDGDCYRARRREDLDLQRRHRRLLRRLRAHRRGARRQGHFGLPRARRRRGLTIAERHRGDRAASARAPALRRRARAGLCA